VTVSRARYNSEYAGLAFNFKVNPDSCGNSVHYENYLRFSALADQNSGKGVTHILLSIDEETNEKAIIGFATVRTSSLIMNVETHHEGRAALEITELAVDIRFEKKGFGKYLVNWAINIADTLRRESVGIEYMTLCADPDSVSFYENNGFTMISTLYDIPREGWNVDCIPMLMKFPELNTK